MAEIQPITILETAPAATCQRCFDTGLVRAEVDGVWVARACECQAAKKVELRLAAAKIPERYQRCTFSSFEAEYPGSGPSLKTAALAARRFLEEYPAGTSGQGLLLRGPTGAGKTHLACALLRALVEHKGAKGLFLDWTTLLEEMRQALRTSAPWRKEDDFDALLEPAMTAEVLVLDDLGAGRPTEWSLEVAGTLLGARYSHCRTTIITTNFRDQVSGARDHEGRAAREDVLMDRIGARAVSRLSEMCLQFEMAPEKDFRRTVKKARLG